MLRYIGILLPLLVLLLLTLVSIIYIDNHGLQHGLVPTAKAQEVAQAENPCVETGTISGSLTCGFVYEGWRVMRNLVNVGLVIGLIAIAFSNILRINIDSYHIKKSLPKILIGVALANASLLIVRFMADLGEVFIRLFMELSGQGSFTGFIVTVLNISQIALIKAFPIAVLLYVVFPVVWLVIVVWLLVIIWLRVATIFILTIFSPIVFLAYGIPGLDKYFKLWWQAIIKNIFMLPAMAAVWWVMILISRTGGGWFDMVYGLVIFALLAISLSIPKKWGGGPFAAVSAKFANIGKNIGNSGVKAAGAGLQAGGVRLGEKGREIKERLAGQQNLTKADTWRKVGGWGGRFAGDIVTAPTAIKEGRALRAKEAQKKQLGYATSGWAFNTAAGGAATGASLKRFKEDVKEIDSVSDVRAAMDDLINNGDVKDLLNNPQYQAAIAELFGTKDKGAIKAAESMTKNRKTRDRLMELRALAQRGGYIAKQPGNDQIPGVNNAVSFYESQYPIQQGGKRHPFVDIDDAESQGGGDQSKNREVDSVERERESFNRIEQEKLREELQSLTRELKDALKEGGKNVEGAIINSFNVGVDTLRRNGFGVEIKEGPIEKQAMELEGHLKEAANELYNSSRGLSPEVSANMENILNNIKKESAGGGGQNITINNIVRSGAEAMGERLSDSDIEKLAQRVSSLAAEKFNSSPQEIIKLIEADNREFIHAMTDEIVLGVDDVRKQAWR